MSRGWRVPRCTARIWDNGVHRKGAGCFIWSNCKNGAGPGRRGSCSFQLILRQYSANTQLINTVLFTLISSSCMLPSQENASRLLSFLVFSRFPSAPLHSCAGSSTSCWRLRGKEEEEDGDGAVLFFFLLRLNSDSSLYFRGRSWAGDWENPWLLSFLPSSLLSLLSFSALSPTPTTWSPSQSWTEVVRARSRPLKAQLGPRGNIQSYLCILTLSPSSSSFLLSQAHRTSPQSPEHPFLSKATTSFSLFFFCCLCSKNKLALPNDLTLGLLCGCSSWGFTLRVLSDLQSLYSRVDLLHSNTPGSGARLPPLIPTDTLCRIFSAFPLSLVHHGV